MIAPGNTTNPLGWDSVHYPSHTECSEPGSITTEAFPSGWFICSFLSFNFTLTAFNLSFSVHLDNDHLSLAVVFMLTASACAAFRTHLESLLWEALFKLPHQSEGAALLTVVPGPPTHTSACDSYLATLQYYFCLPPYSIYKHLEATLLPFCLEQMSNSVFIFGQNVDNKKAEREEGRKGVMVLQWWIALLLTSWFPKKEKKQNNSGGTGLIPSPLIILNIPCTHISWHFSHPTNTQGLHFSQKLPWPLSRKQTSLRIKKNK